MLPSLLVPTKFWQCLTLPSDLQCSGIPSLKKFRAMFPVLHLSWMNIAFSETSVRHGGGQQG